MTGSLGGDPAKDAPPAPRHEPTFPNTTQIARREYLELIRSRLAGLCTPRPFNLMIDADVFRVFCENATVGANQARKDGVTQRTAAAGLRPPPLRVL